MRYFSVLVQSLPRSHERLLGGDCFGEIRSVSRIVWGNNWRNQILYLELIIRGDVGVSCLLISYGFHDSLPRQDSMVCTRMFFFLST